MLSRLDRDAVLTALPPEWPQDLRSQIRNAIQGSAQRVCVLDDDPTGTQTVHGLTVYMDWAVETLVEALHSAAPTFYLLTNSRSLPLAQAQQLNHEVGANLREASARTGIPIVVVSRSDSTLRGHFPGEVQALAGGLGQTFDAWLLAPFFLEGGRYTLNNGHYVAEGAQLIPADQTPFAQDAAFGYHTAHLPTWVAEKTAGRVAAEAVASISLSDLREGGPQVVAKKLRALHDGVICVINAVSYRDLEVFVAGLLEAEAAGGRYLYRTAASFVAVRSGVFERPLLRAVDLGTAQPGGGLFVVGSYVPTTGRQLAALLASDIAAFEVNVTDLLDENRCEAIIADISAQANTALQAGRDTLIYTSRQLIRAEAADGSLHIGQRVSAGLIAIVQGITTRPCYALVKGGITASDIATQAFGMRRARVLGQLLPGVPVWQMGVESCFPDLPYIVFPGNVGADDALLVSRKILNGEVEPCVQRQ